jgi:hypothetical protein
MERTATGRRRKSILGAQVGTGLRAKAALRHAARRREEVYAARSEGASAAHGVRDLAMRHARAPHGQTAAAAVVEAAAQAGAPFTCRTHTFFCMQLEQFLAVLQAIRSSTWRAEIPALLQRVKYATLLLYLRLLTDAQNAGVSCFDSWFFG